MKNKRQAEAGITLLEMLLALALMAMLGVALIGLLQTGGQVWLRTVESGGKTDHAVARYDMRDKLENMPITTAAIRLPEIFIGAENTFTFAPNEDDLTIQHAVEQRDGHLVFVNQGFAQTLEPDISRLSITYFGRKTVRQEAAWFPDWTEATILPKAIKIESWDTDGRVNTPLTIRPGINTLQNEISLSSPVPPG